jgi:hypothetical protein
LIRLPDHRIYPERWYPHKQVAGILHKAADLGDGERRDDEPLVTLRTDTEGNYQVTPDPLGHIHGSDDDHRQIIFLDARVLLRTS